MKRALTFLFAILLVFCIAETTYAAIVQFVPPNDPIGRVWSINSIDGYGDGRGMAFEMQSDVTIDSIGIYHDMTNVNLSFDLAQTLIRTGQVHAGQTILVSGSRNVSTNGLQWIDFTFAPITLSAGKYYQFEFYLSGSGNQNFYYDQCYYPTFNQDNFLYIDGTWAGYTYNGLIPALRVNTVNSAVPEPASMALLGMGLAGLLGFRRKKVSSSG